MSLRSSLTKLSSMRFRMLGATLAAVAGLAGVATSGGGCGGNSTLQCGPNMTNCMICDGLGCRPATPNGTSSAGSGGSGGATASSSSGGTGGASTSTSTSTSSSSGAAACDPTQATCACVNGQCPSGLQCVSGLCVKGGCDYTYQCGKGRVCINGGCATGCSSTNPCPAGYTCTGDTGGATGACLPDPTNPQCSTTKPCPTGQVCGPDGICATGCTATSQCTAGEVCDGTSHTCVPNPAPTPACSTAMPCPAPQVCETDGFCHLPCTSVAQCQQVDNRFVACDGYCKTQQEVMPQCTQTMPCPTGKNCISNTCF